MKINDGKQHICIIICFKQVLNEDEKNYKGNKIDKGNISVKLNKQL